MLFEPSTLAATTTALASALETYGCDPRSVFARAGLEFDRMHEPGARYPFSGMSRLWEEARLASGDPCIGLMAARRIKPTALHALGLSWMASPTLYAGFRRMARYSQIANTALRISIREADGEVVLTPAISDSRIEPAPEGIDATLAFIVSLCRFVTNRHFAPTRVAFRHDPNEHIDQYVGFFAAPVFFSSDEDALYFDAAVARAQIPAGNEALAEETDRIADRYLATLEPRQVQSRVREILLTLLPSGEAGQELVARKMNRSVSALQRQLKAEGASYRQVLDETRHMMGLRLVEENQYSLGEIAYLLGFSDQANFSRAFRRWTGKSPKAYRTARVDGSGEARAR